MRLLSSVGLFMYEGVRRLGTVLWAWVGAGLLIGITANVITAPVGAVLGGFAVGYFLYTIARDKRPAWRMAMGIVVVGMGLVADGSEHQGWQVASWITVATILVLFARLAYIRPEESLPAR